MDFSQALIELKAGKKVRRKNGFHEKNNLYIALFYKNEEADKYTSTATEPYKIPIETLGIFLENGKFLTDKTVPTVYEALGIEKPETYKPEVYLLFIPTMEGLLADDWYVVE